MDTVIREINESLLKILNELDSRKLASHKDLENVNNQINAKVDEAKEYKTEVDTAKSKIKTLEQEIESLEIDLVDLNERFGKKDLNAILEAGHKEINSKIMEKQNQITKYRQKIGELADRARSIKDLLINLKKDKTSKEDKLDVLTKTHEYYNDSLNKIIDYAKNNPQTLNSYDLNYNNLNYDYEDEPLSEVFDEIESLDKEDEEDIKIKVEENEELSEEEETNLNNIFDKLRNKDLNFDEINKSIDQEYDNIFGANNQEEKSEELKFEEDTSTNMIDISENELNAPIEKKEETNIFDQPEETINKEDIVLPDIFGNETKQTENISNVEIENLFKEYDLDFNKFNKEDQKIIKNIFNLEHFQKILAILKDNQINLEYIYQSINVFEKGNPEELDLILTKLLLAGQSKANIDLVLDNLGEINSSTLTEVINSYGSDIKDVNITDILIKTMKLANVELLNNKPDYLLDSDFTDEEIKVMESSINQDIWEKVINFPQIILVNYYYLKELGISNIKEVFMSHPQMFVLNPDKFKAIFVKYDKADLVRCIEKNAAVIEKL